MLRTVMSDHAEIHALAEALRTAVNRGDVDGVIACWAGDGVLMPPHHAVVQGHVEIAEYFREVFAARSLSFTFTGSSVTLLGDVAVERLAYSVVATSVSSGAVAEDVGKGVHVCARGHEGGWRITQDIWNSDQA